MSARAARHAATGSSAAADLGSAALSSPSRATALQLPVAYTSTARN